MGILVFLFLGIIVLINIISLIFSDEVMKKNKRAGFLIGLAFNGGATIFCFLRRGGGFYAASDKDA